MKQVVLIPDSFKGTMASEEICRILAGEFRRRFPECRVTEVPVADGGEGSVDAFLQALGGEKIPALVQGPLGKPVDAFYGILPDGTAVIEMAAAAGLPLVGEEKNPEIATTYGVGQLMKDAMERGCRKLIVGLGGSATNDGGCGAAAALGIAFRNPQGESFVPTGKTLSQIASIHLEGKHPLLDQTEILTMCDIRNPLCGETGAARVFGPQKGADEAMVLRLDQGLAHLAEIVKRDTGSSILHVPGAGAAGGMGGGMAAFFGSTLQLGIETVLDTVHFDSLLEKADLVVTGEGKLDAQSLGGKVVIGVARRAKKAGVPVLALVGDIGNGIEPVYEEGVSAVFSINRVAVPYKEARLRAREDLRETMASILRLWKLAGREEASGCSGGTQTAGNA